MNAERAIRSAGRSIRFAIELARTAVEFAKVEGDPAHALHRSARRILRAMGVRLEIAGPLPGNGLLVCNHLGYLDVLVLSSIAPSVFVAKSEVGTWPILGWFVRRAGTIFVERGRSGSAPDCADKIGRTLRAGRRVVLFPEGTSSGGQTVLPFKSSLLEAAVGIPAWAAALEFDLEPGDGDASEDVCYWKDMVLLPHLIRLLGKRSITCRVRFCRQPEIAFDRKALALALRQRVLDLREVGYRSDLPISTSLLPLPSSF